MFVASVINLLSVIAITCHLESTIANTMCCQMPSQTPEILQNALAVGVLSPDVVWGCNLTKLPS